MTRTSQNGGGKTTTPLASPNPSPHPSPVLFPTSPMFQQQTEAFESNQAISAGSQKLAISALDTLLCALVDRPKNMRAFEESGGLESIVKVLKDRNVAQQVRYDDTVSIRCGFSVENSLTAQNQNHRNTVLLPAPRNESRSLDFDHSLLDLFCWILSIVGRNNVKSFIERFHPLATSRNARECSQRLCTSNSDETEASFWSPSLELPQRQRKVDDAKRPRAFTKSYASAETERTST